MQRKQPVWAGPAIPLPPFPKALPKAGGDLGPQFTSLFNNNQVQGNADSHIWVLSLKGLATPSSVVLAESCDFRMPWSFVYDVPNLSPRAVQRFF